MNLINHTRTETSTDSYIFNHDGDEYEYLVFTEKRDNFLKPVVVDKAIYDKKGSFIMACDPRYTALMSLIEKSLDNYEQYKKSFI